MSKKLVIYTLELEDGFFYVGKTYSLKKRLSKHFKGKGSAWTKLHKPLNLINIEEYEVNFGYEEDYYENKTTINLMKEKGWNKVRGGFWSNISDYDTIKGLHHHNYFTEIKISDIQFDIRTYTIFVLELEENKIFVGFSSNPKKALKNHSNGKASKWTKLYKPIGVIETRVFKSNTGKIDMNFVDEIVLEYCKKYDPSNVRGGSFIYINDLHHKKYYNNKIA